MKVKKIETFCTMLVLALLLSGCVGRDHYNERQKNEVIEKGRPILEVYINSLGAQEVSLGECSMLDGIIEGGLMYSGPYLSGAVLMEFTAEGDNYKAVVNIEDGKIWTNYYMFDLNKHIKRQLLPFCEKYGFTSDFEVVGAYTYAVLHFKQLPTNSLTGECADTYVLIEDMILSEYNDTNEDLRADSFLTDAPLDAFGITYDTANDAFFDPEIIMDYLKESGNYKVEDTRSKVRGEYRINGEVQDISIPDDTSEQ